MTPKEHDVVELTCYPISGRAPQIEPAPLERHWMEKSEGFAYRCLPLNIANAHGWIIRNEAAFFAEWDGNDGLESVRIVRGSGADRDLLASSHFGSGILTFNVRGLLRTSPGYDLWVTGPVNMIKDGIQPLSAVVESDWTPTSFTMNWKFTREFTTVWFDENEPFCMIFPLPRRLIDCVQPAIRSLDDNPELKKGYEIWSKSRRDFNRSLSVPGSDARRMKWQKNYLRGEFSGWHDAPESHQTRLKAKPFK